MSKRRKPKPPKASWQPHPNTRLSITVPELGDTVAVTFWNGRIGLHNYYSPKYNERVEYRVHLGWRRAGKIAAHSVWFFPKVEFPVIFR